jgi:N-acetyl-alpha-D-muramate 1-phosphate uridylyltransferase
MRPLTDKLPKPLLPIGGKPLIVWHLEKCAAAGITEIVVNVSYLREQIQACLGDGSRWGVNITYSVETTPLESGGGIAQALPLLGAESFALISADVFSDFDYRLLKPTPAAHWILVPQQADLIGEFGLQSGQLTPPVTGQANYSWASIAVLHPGLCAHMPRGERFKLMPYLQTWIKAGQVSAEATLARWDNITTPEQYQAIKDHHDQSSPSL